MQGKHPEVIHAERALYELRAGLYDSLIAA